jgi:hypothetical protein
VILVAATVIVCALVAIAATRAVGAGHHQRNRAQVVAAFWAGGVPVGSLTLSGRPLWVSVVVHGVAESGPVTCRLVSRRGSEKTMAQFDLVHGSGSWAAPDPGSLAEYRQARLVDAAGRVIAAAALR